MASKKNVFQTIQKKRKFADRPMSESEMTEGSTDTSKDSTGAKAVTERAVGVPESPQKTTDNNNGVVTLNINNTTDNNIGIVTLNMKTTTDSNIGVVTQDMKTTTDNNIGVVTQNMNKLTDNNIGVVTQNMNTTTDNNIGVVTCEQIPALPETPKIDNVDAKPVVYTIAPDKLRKIDNVDAKPGVYTIAPDKLRNIDNVDAEPVVYTIAPDKLRSLDADEDGSFHTMLAETISESEIIATTEVTNIVVKHGKRAHITVLIPRDFFGSVLGE
ncbi:hypothetical protein DPMN_122520 [Dreissena polymorpha]|uniref:Uncharacterized protein n=1 Tax=Dreissena polymorpha TaxID=45954 RepID=A0A9D4GNR2_DREPO|nr:hypothetical protein DPMN_122520 [Dreissena polymorpha]